MQIYTIMLETKQKKKKEIRQLIDRQAEVFLMTPQTRLMIT